MKHTDDQTSAANRRKLEALFSSGSVAALSQRSAAQPPRTTPLDAKRSVNGNGPRRTHGKTVSEFWLRRETLRNARDPAEIERAADIFLQHHQCPDDLELLLKLVLHPREKVQCEAMGQLSSLLLQKRMPNTFLLADKLSQLACRDLGEATRSCVEGLQWLIAARRNEE